MSASFTLEEILSATSGRLHGPPPPGGSFTNVSTDTRTVVQGALFVALVGERFDAHNFLAEAASRGATAAVIQKGRTLPGGLPGTFPLIAVDDTLAALGRIARHHRLRFRIPIGAVTGSNGKTTTKEMIASILSLGGPALKTEGNLNNEIGVPLTLFRMEPQHTSAIIEMGMNHLGEIARLTAITEPDAGLITVVQPAHLEGLGTIENVARAKGELFQGLPAHGIAVVNNDDPRIVEQAKASGHRQLTFGRSGGDVQLVESVSRGAEGQLLKLRHEGRDYPIALHFLGAHNALNATGAFALARALGVPAEVCAEGLEQARPHSRRLQLVQGTGGVQVLDDCYNANPASMAAALETLETQAKDAKGRAVAVLGDMLELGADEIAAHRELGEKAARVGRVVAFFGPRSAAAAEAAKTQNIESAHFTDLDALLGWLTPKLSSGDTVLVKGSRGMRLERVVQALTGTSPAGDGHT